MSKIVQNRASKDCRFRRVYVPHCVTERCATSARTHSCPQPAQPPCDRASLDSPLSTIGTEHDIVILDARQNLLKARNTAQLLKTAGITIPLMIVLTEGGMAAVSASWQVDDIVLDQASPSEMDARLRLLVTAPELKDTDDRSQQIIRIGNLVIDAQTYSAHLNGAALNLTFKEFELLKFVAQHPGRVFRGRSYSRRSGATIHTMAVRARSMYTFADCVQSSVLSTNR